MTDEFENLKGYEEYYQINRKGDIRNIKRNTILTPNFDKDGYKIAMLYNPPKSVKIHRLLAIQYILNDDPLKTEIDHIDRNRTNNDLVNLRWTNRSGNNQNRFRRGCISTYIGFRKNGEPYTNFRGSYTIPDENGGMKTIRKSSCFDRQIVEDWLEDMRNQYP
jgi:hypothetical protein